MKLKLINLVHGLQISKLMPEWQEMTTEAIVTITLPDGYEFPGKYVAKLAGMGWTLKDGMLSIGEKKASKRASKKTSD